ncbi:hypothetical protein QLQ12_23760 [Actinoplanes sp. NEAU-A12]|uniref:ATP-binding protein n=1 Tax=Actinoplanes sandaracinus TaxID=3045177 RepID=A0ABT6WPE8_9ACTN|nr:hypothetical protein [Actinoplanes sandaracinus]MDI6101642.1 hypothetical protein [Actinoplanes sandaracinus]
MDWRDSDVIPSKFLDAEIEHPAAEQWAAEVLSGGHPRLLVLGPSYSGKTYLKWTALRRLLAGGYPPEQVAVHDRVGAVRGGYSPSIIDDGPSVIALDNLTDRIDNMVGVAERYRGTDEPELQAMMAAADACVSDAVARLARRPNTSWIMCASGVEQLTTLHGEQTAAVVTSLAETVTLQKRPLNMVMDW